MNLLHQLTFINLMNHCLCGDILPVFMIDSDGVMADTITEPNPFHKTDSKDFHSILRKGINKYEMAIIFVEDDFSVEDTSIKDIKGTPFYNLRQRILQGKAKYLPAVRKPYQIISSILPPMNQNIFYLNSPSTQINLPDGVKYFYIKFVDSKNETRARALRRHDAIMESVYFSIRQFSPGPVLALYTGKRNPVVVKPFDLSKYKVKKVDDPTFLIESDACLLSFHGFSIMGATRRHSLSNLPKVTDEKCTNKKLSTKIAYMDYELQFDFTFRAYDWILDSVGLLEEGEEIGRTHMGISAPYKCAYSCSDPLVIVNNRDGSAVSIAQYKIQPFPKKRTRRDEPSSGAGSDGGTGGDGGGGYPVSSDGGDSPAPAPDPPAPAPSAPSDDKKKFGSTVDCGPYFNVAIISSLAVVFVCIGTFLYFITLMMSCHTNDRYDDSNSKPLVIYSQG